jgi:hypothetical protein
MLSSGSIRRYVQPRSQALSLCAELSLERIVNGECLWRECKNILDVRSVDRRCLTPSKV